MAIRDLLWACPLCHRIESIADDGRCQGCGAAFRRGHGARIEAGVGATASERTAVEWLALLPWPDLDGDGRVLPGDLEPPFTQPATVRMSTTEAPLRRGQDLLGWVERFSRPIAGQITLSADCLAFEAGLGAGWSWPLTEITAVQPASSSIQVKSRANPVVSVRFPAGSLRLWEQRLQYCVRGAYARAGKGEIVEFQPHIRVR